MGIATWRWRGPELARLAGTPRPPHQAAPTVRRLVPGPPTTPACNSAPPPQAAQQTATSPTPASSHGPAASTLLRSLGAQQHPAQVSVAIHHLNGQLPTPLVDQVHQPPRHPPAR